MRLSACHENSKLSAHSLAHSLLFFSHLSILATIKKHQKTIATWRTLWSLAQRVGKEGHKTARARALREASMAAASAASNADTTVTEPIAPPGPGPTFQLPSV